MKRNIGCALTLWLLASTAAYAQLEPFEDYDLSEAVWQVTTVKVQPNMGDDYLEGLKQTWVASNELAKELGQIEDYTILGSVLPDSGDFNLVLMVKFKNMAEFAFSKDKYQAFMEAWGEQQQAASREIAKDYPAMREISGEYLFREVTINTE